MPLTPYYEQDGQVIYHGDCREILPQLGTSFDLMATDPPFGIYSKGGKWGKKDQHKWDKKPGELKDVFPYARDHLIWGGNYFSLRPSRGWLVWYKRDSVASASDVELAWTSRDMNSRLIDCTISQTNGERIGHPTQKPLKVMKWSLSFFPCAETIIDPFLGSGTTLVAAKLAGIQGVGIELEEKYCEIAAKRLEQQVLTFPDETVEQPEQMTLKLES